MLSYEELKERQKGLGGSDMAALFGVSPYRSSYELYIEKTIEDPIQIQVKKEHCDWGNLLENVIAKRYEEEKDVKTYKCDRFFHPTHPLFFATPDRLVEMPDGSKKGLECKNVGDLKQLKLWGSEGSQKIPDYYYPQIATYMFVCDHEQWDVAALLHGNEMRTYTFYRDREFDSKLLEVGEEFWRGHVEKRISPQLEAYNKRAKEFLKRLYPTVEEKSVIQLPDDLLPWTRVLQQSKDFVKQYTKSAEIAEAHILHYMKNHQEGILSDGSFFTRKAVKIKEYTVPERVDIRLEYKTQKENQNV